MSFCSNCGHQIPDNGRFCPNCGKDKLAQYPQYQPVRSYVPVQYPPVAPVPPRSNSNVPVILVIIVVVIIAGLLMVALIPATMEKGTTDDSGDTSTVDTSNTFFSTPSSSMIVGESDLGSEWTNETIPSGDTIPVDGVIDSYEVRFNKSSGNGWIVVTISMSRYASIPEANNRFSFRQYALSGYFATEEFGVGDGSYFWTPNDVFYDSYFIKGNVIVSISVDNQTPYYIDGGAIIKEVANKQARLITN